MKARFLKFVPLREGEVTITLKATYADIPELVTFLQEDVWLSAIQTEISESRSAILMGIRETLRQIAQQIEKELSHEEI